MGKFTLGTYVKPEKSNEWAEDVKELAEATNADPNTSATLTLDIKDESKSVLAIRAAAKDINKTARIVRRDDSGVTRIGQKENGKPVFQGNVVIEIQLVDKYKDGRGRPKGSSNGKPDDAPVEPPVKGK